MQTEEVCNNFYILGALENYDKFSDMKIAIVRRDGLGDLLAAFPLILYCRKKFPKAKIILFADERNASLLPFLPPLDKVVILKGKGNKYLHLLKALKWRSLRFDLAISAKTSPMKLMNFFLFCLGAKKRIAYTNASWHALLINEKRHYSAIEAKKTHQALKGLKLLDSTLQEIPQSLYPSLHVPITQRLRYPLPAGFSSPLLVMTASTSKAGNRLNASRYATIVNRFANESNFSILLLTEERDLMRAREMQGALLPKTHLWVTKEFEEFITACYWGDYFFVGDGGIAHIAAALQKNLLVLFGGNNPIEWKPLSEKCELIYHPEKVDDLSDDLIFEKLKKFSPF